MSERRWSLSVLPETLAVARLEPRARVPDWAGSPSGRFSSVTRTASELSIVCEASRVPGEVRAERDWRALVVAGPLDFSEVGVLAALTATLAAAEVSVFAISTFDTDYLLVRDASLTTAIEALGTVGHTVVG